MFLVSQFYRPFRGYYRITGLSRGGAAPPLATFCRASGAAFRRSYVMSTDQHFIRSLPRISLLTLLLAALPPAIAHNVSATDSSIRLNTVGFLPTQSKRASIPAVACSDFSIVNAVNGSVAFRGKMSGPIHNVDTKEDLCIADFSAMRQPGVYRLIVAGVGSSPPFRIGRDIYNSSFRSVVRAMHLWRCGTAVKAEYNGVVYSHGACHLEDAWLDLAGGGHARRDSTGGWHDAGDYNKYVVNAGVTLGIMFRAWEEYAPRIRRVEPKVSAGGRGLPAYLNEIKWETDWLLTMQAADGSVYHKVSTKEFGPAIMPESELTQRYFAPWSSAATADFVAMMATSARVFLPYDREYARRCIGAARKGYAFLQKHPENKGADLKDFSTGAYQTDDADDRLCAAAEMWETTGERKYLMDLERRARAFKFRADWGWSNVENLGLLTYLFSRRGGRDARLVRQIQNNLIATADGIVEARNAHGYARPLGTKYYWGCNGGVANTTVLLQAANRLKPTPVYVETTLDAISHLLGRNYYGRSFVTGLGENPPQHPHDRRSMGRAGAPAWPGYLVGGGWPNAIDWKDDESNYRVNEIAINWNAPLIYALAGFIE